VSRQVVCDSSALVALLTDDGDAGRFAASALSETDLCAPHLVAFESANVLRRLELAGLLSSDAAAQAHADLLDLRIELWPYEPLAPRVRELRPNLTAYDASYVALAELTGASVVTLDGALGAAPGVRCEVRSP
jgi:predicted nucleic acid-binding protein